MIPGTRMDPFSKLFASNQTGSSITAPIPTVTEPTGDGILNLESINRVAGALSPPNSVVVAFFGARTGANQTATARLTGWRKIGTLWIPVPLLALALTQGTSIGIAATDVVATDYFVDTITASTAFTSAYELISPADDTVAAVKVDLFGCEKLQVQVAKGTCTSVNALAASF